MAKISGYGIIIISTFGTKTGAGVLFYIMGVFGYFEHCTKEERRMR